MKYLSIDIETTGLDPEKHQIIEFAAVFDDLMNPHPVQHLQHLCLKIAHENYVWSPEAYRMNSALFNEIIDGAEDASLVQGHDQMAGYIERWLYNLGPVNARYTCAGKNFGSFDLQFLKRHATRRWWHHRCIDPGSIFLWANDEVPPSTEKCLCRAGLNPNVKHRALDDALDVVRLVRHHFGVPIE